MSLIVFWREHPFRVLARPALKLVSKGWHREAFQCEYGGKFRMQYVVQAAIWKDSKLFGILTNYKVDSTDGTNKVKRWNKSRKKYDLIASPTVVTEYNEHYGGVDRMDRMIADYTISRRAKRFYMRIFYWLLDNVVNSCYLIATDRVKDQPNHPWYKYTKRHGRRDFQWDLAMALIRRGILLDCPSAADGKILNDPKNRPAYMRRGQSQWPAPCDCNECPFCEWGYTYGVSSPVVRNPKSLPRFREPLYCKPADGDHPTSWATAHKRKKDRCYLCVDEQKKKNAATPRTEREKYKSLYQKATQSRRGCNSCRAGAGVNLCQDHFITFDHKI
jgi:Transposase IS4